MPASPWFIRGLLDRSGGSLDPATKGWFVVLLFEEIRPLPFCRCWRVTPSGDERVGCGMCNLKGSFPNV